MESTTQIETLKKENYIQMAQVIALKFEIVAIKDTQIAFMEAIMTEVAIIQATPKGFFRWFAYIKVVTQIIANIVEHVRKNEAILKNKG